MCEDPDDYGSWFVEADWLIGTIVLASQDGGNIHPISQS